MCNKGQVDFMTAVTQGKRIRVEHELLFEDDKVFMKKSSILSMLKEYGEREIGLILKDGKWYIE